MLEDWGLAALDVRLGEGWEEGLEAGFLGFVAHLLVLYYHLIVLDSVLIY